MVNLAPKLLGVKLLSLSLVVLCVTSTTPKWRKWLPVATDVSALSDFSPRRLRAASAVLCFAHASSLDEPANAACYRDHECHVAQVNTELAVHESSDWSCYQSPVCFSASGEQFMFLPLVKVPPCEVISYQGNCTVGGIRYQMIGGGAPKQLEECGTPFVQEEFGCVYLETERSASACEARRSCNSIGGELASPKSLEKLEKLGKWLSESGSSDNDFWVGVFFFNGRWRSLRDGAPVPRSDDFFQNGQADEDGNNGQCARVKLDSERGWLADRECDTELKFVCEVFK